jgi:hypothetical protein
VSLHLHLDLGSGAKESFTIDLGAMALNHPPNEDHGDRASRYLKATEGTFVFDAKRGFEVPKGQESENKAKEEYPGSSEKSRFFTDPKADIFARFISFGTFVLVCLTALFTGCQLVLARKATDAAQKAAYEACLGAQISHDTLIQLQQGEADTHAAAVASMYQAVVATRGERAEIEMKWATPRVQLDKDIGLPFQVFNSGQTEALNVRFALRLEFLPRHSDPDFTYPNGMIVRGGPNSLRAGRSAQAFGDPSIEPVVTVKGANHKPVIASAEDVGDYLEGRKDLIAHGTYSYKDIFGVEHWGNFCQPFQKIQPGYFSKTDHPMCTHYNKSDINSALPVPSPPMPPQSISEIKCTEPK